MNNARGKRTLKQNDEPYMHKILVYVGSADSVHLPMLTYMFQELTVICIDYRPHNFIYSTQYDRDSFSEGFDDDYSIGQHIDFANTGIIYIGSSDYGRYNFGENSFISTMKWNRKNEVGIVDRDNVNDESI